MTLDSCQLQLPYVAAKHWLNGSKFARSRSEQCLHASHKMHLQRKDLDDNSAPQYQTSKEVSVLQSGLNRSGIAVRSITVTNQLQQASQHVALSNVYHIVYVTSIEHPSCIDDTCSSTSCT